MAGNPVFDFKQFSVHQGQSGMKVSTDACIFATWVASKLQQSSLIPVTILDIGVGTGLLSLILAQSFENAKIEGIDIDEKSCTDAAYNFSISPWNSRLSAACSDARDIKIEGKHELIICNPPFFNSGSSSKNKQKKLAWHAEKLPLSLIESCIINQVNSGGTFAVMYPLTVAKALKTQLQSNSIAPSFELHYAHNPEKEAHVCMMIFNAKIAANEVEKLYYKMLENEDSIDFITLMQAFYLFL